MKKFRKLLLILFFYCAFFLPGKLFSQSFSELLSKIHEIEFKEIENENFAEYYEVFLRQPVDHFGTKGAIFNQRIYIGFRDSNAPVVFETGGYAVDYASVPGFTNELAKEFNANLIVAEHRYFGKSLPGILDWNFLSMRQSAEDFHRIRELLAPLFKGKWIATGISKGGQSALALKMYYPDDIAVVLVYGTAVKNSPVVFSDTLLSALMNSACGKKLSGLQFYSFRHKNDLIPLMQKYFPSGSGDDNSPDAETILDYMLLELPFSFWQNGIYCEDVPDTNASPETLVDYLAKIVPPRYFSAVAIERNRPAFYMFYHELGYYEYNTGPFQAWLKQETYSNNIFAPRGRPIEFDNRFQTALLEFMKTPASDSVFFIYGEYDPWALQSTVYRNSWIVKSGSHRSRMRDLDPLLSNELKMKIRFFLK